MPESVAAATLREGFRDLVLFRHGKTERTAANGGGDSARALLPRGRMQAADLALRLQAAGFTPELALVSPAVRTLQTWDVAKPAWPDCAVDTPSDLYLAEAGALTSIAETRARLTGASSILLIGHNPGLHDCVLDAASHGMPDGEDSRILERMPTSAAVWLHRAAAGAPWRVRRVFWPAPAAVSGA